jgi:serine O-acetyltransferase
MAQTLKSMWALFRQDVQRWIEPQKIADPSLVTFKTTQRLLLRHIPLRAMLLFRFGSWCMENGVRMAPGSIQRRLYFRYGLEMAPGADIGGGLYIAHPVGTVIMVSHMGENCSIVANVTIGLRNEHKFPTIGDNVFIGAGARVLGDIRIGDGAKIGANAVVIHDVPAGATVVGIPARVVNDRATPPKIENSNHYKNREQVRAVLGEDNEN